MKKYTIITALFLLTMFSSSFAQDLIVTKKGDSINAQITKINKVYYYFRFVKDGEVRNTLLPKEEIKELKKEYYKVSEIPNNYKRKVDKDFSRFRFALQGGLGYRTAKTFSGFGPSLKKHIDELKSGVNFGGDFYYFFGESIGVGLKYSRFYSSHVTQDILIVYDDNPGVTEFGIKNTIQTNFIGFSLASRYNFGSTEKHQLFLTFAPGYLSYSDDEQSGNRSFKITGDTIGLNYDFEYNYNIYKNLFLGVQLSYLTGALNEVEIEENGVKRKRELDGDNKESLNTFNISVGLRLELN
ncbi:outer membrane beta-barrel protein [Wenyingzhuangia sp. IMCC45533]